MRLLLGALAVCGLAVSAVAQTPVGPGRQATPPAAPAAPAQADYLFPSGAGIFFFYVHPEKTADFEAILTRLRTVLDQTEDPTRREQAASWRMFKSVETSRDAAIYVFFFDPAVAGASYDPVKVLGEALPAEAQALYDQLRACVIRVERMGLRKLR